MACLDTTLLIDLGGAGGRAMRKRAEEKVRSLRERGQRLTTTRINVAELLVGVWRSKDRAKEQLNADAALEFVTILEFDAKAADVFAQTTAGLLDRGRPIGDMDVLIAAIAIANAQALITRNISDFNEIPELVVESY